ncbi:BZ3500_MvSof-1268-A1-R1_Chr2-2g04862 [Microbotryum saponariae]|uniref:NADH dehydrogenase [ubiquinone] 1 beta subcomplex subunit 11, mitochondrial n=1 Tax=Microbotryum saponariae TaxID=289078 RepID=A0A2X0KAA3_9BASI|nr:BZ3500_MvSof-1268-A1-R1_Chr2-2g04862 [Microbotryum saponariae]SDA00349.1 BZ3501_MvSof-1269-A2-R1_Chr2-2g04536 [Microbotryum saponariae]
MSRLLMTRALTPMLRSTPKTMIGARSASAGQQYNPPTGYLFGEKASQTPSSASALSDRGEESGRESDEHPHTNSVLTPNIALLPILTGQKRVREDWELIFYWGFGGGIALAAVLKFYQPDTSLEGWARKEAKAKMAAAGETVSRLDLSRMGKGVEGMI